MKTNKNSNGLIALVIFAISVVFMSFTLFSGIMQKPWNVPADMKSKKNPVASNEESIATGKSIYNKSCASCHGKLGLGDGVKARSIETFPGDFSKEAYQKQTDGEHFYKTKVGRGEMPAYDGKIPDEDIWSVVNYMRTFKK